MSALDVESLLQPVSSEDPAGPDVQYDERFIALEEAAKEKAEQQYGETIIPAVEPDWKEVRRLGLELLGESRDLRVAAHITRAMAELEGLTGAAECIALIRGYVEQFWETAHPRLDPDDDNDPTERVNIIASLADTTTTVSQLLNAPLVRSTVLGSFSMRDVQVARGEIPAHVDDPPADMAAIEAAFMDCDLDELRDKVAAATKACDDAQAIETVVTDQVGAANAASMDSLTKTLRAIQEFLADRLTWREGQVEAAAAEEAGEGTTSASPVAVAVAAGEIRSREDVIRALDKICEYYERNEPSSPLPMLLRRAKRLVTKGFMDILADLTPDGVSQARQIGGVDQGSGEED